MKKITLLFMLASLSGFAQTINIPDAAFKTILLSSSTQNSIAQDFNYQSIQIDSNNDGEIQVSEALQVVRLTPFTSFNYNLFITIQNIQGIENFVNLEQFIFNSAMAAQIDLSSNVNLKELVLAFNPNLSSLNITNNSNLEILNISDTPISALNITNNVNLKDLRFNGTLISSIDFSNCPLLNYVNCQNTPIIELDFSNNRGVYIGCGGNALKYVNIKNGFADGFYIYPNFLAPNLEYICCDDSELALLNVTTGTTYPYIQIGTYCSFTPGGTFYTIAGESKFDGNANGCDPSDINLKNLKFDVTSSGVTGSFYAKASGNYSIPVQQGVHTIVPKLENPSYFNITPTSITANFPTQTSPLNQNFCITPNGIHYDLEITCTLLQAAIPGFDAYYKLIFKNKGNQVQSGIISLNFNDAVLDFVSSIPAEASVLPNILTWNYSNLKPFETREVNFIMNLNSPMETPPLNMGDRIAFTGNIQPTNTAIIDDNPDDNAINVNFGVVNSADPNDITCLEGNSVGINQVGKYVHYMIRFENIGTANAINVVIKNLIDATKFDVESLIPLSSNYDYFVRRRNNQYEFIFENIQLPFDDANNDGYVLYKIKLKNNLTLGATFTNQANIYFDFNFPIITNIESTTISALSTSNFDEDKIKIYPNPTSGILNIQTDNISEFNIEIFDLIGKKVGQFSNQNQLDISNYKSGIYLIKITDLQSNMTITQKVIKQ
jgi:hypothetical protein